MKVVAVRFQVAGDIGHDLRHVGELPPLKGIGLVQILAVAVYVYPLKIVCKGYNLQAD